MVSFRDGVTDAVSGSFLMADALSAQSKAAEDLVSANEDLASAQADVAAANAIVESASEKYLSARGRKARREAYEELQKAALELVPVQQKLADATDVASAAQAKQLSFLERLQQQADRAKGFAAKLQQLVSLGLSEKGLQEIVSAGAETGGAMADELIKGGSGAIKRTNELFAEIGEVAKKTGMNLADNFYKIGDNVGADFVAALAKQAENAEKFAAKVKELVAAGFSPAAIQQVLNAGVKAGTEIAQALLDGGEQAVAESTRLHDSLRATADSLKTLLGDKFYQTGIDLAQKIVDGLQAKLDDLSDLLPDMTIPQLKDTLNGIAPEVKKIIDGATVATSVVSTGNAEMDSIIGRFSGKARDVMLERAGFMAFADGGIVNSAQLGLVGEAGPEAIIPLSRLEGMMGGGGTQISVTVNAGMGANGSTIADTIVNELIKYQRRNGKIPITTL
jgi:hypothetical protein